MRKGHEIELSFQLDETFRREVGLAWISTGCVAYISNNLFSFTCDGAQLEALFEFE